MGILDLAMQQRWRSAPNDEIGGWCVLLESETRSPAQGAIEIADFLDKTVADHIAGLHNEWLES